MVEVGGKRLEVVLPAGLARGRAPVAAGPALARRTGRGPGSGPAGHGPPGPRATS